MFAGVKDTAAESVAVSAGAAESAGTAESAGAVESASVETLMAPPVLGMQKSPRCVGKQFRDRFTAAPVLKV
jgi:hypothetical protein